MAEKYDGLERRKWSRMVREVALEYRAPNGVSLDHLSQFKKATLANVSGGGLCFKTNTYIPVDTIIEFQFGQTTHKGRKAVSPVHANGKVIWIKLVGPGKYELGLEFLDFDEDQRKAISKNMAKGSSKSGTRGGKKDGGSSSKTA